MLSFIMNIFIEAENYLHIEVKTNEKKKRKHLRIGMKENEKKLIFASSNM